MSEIGPSHPVTYRGETLAALFDLVSAGESAAVIASASMGKSRLVQFLLRDDVALHYLEERTENFLSVWIDCNRLGDFTAWHLYELFLDALLTAIEERPDLAELANDYRGLHLEVIRSENALLAQRVLERLARLLCRDHGLTLCLVLDEFDEAYARLPAPVLASLRALRDANKYRLCYLLFTRQHPQYLRDPADCEGLYEQFSRNILYLQPYQPDDARRVMQQLAVRLKLDTALLDDSVTQEVLALSGGHPGLMVALLSGLNDTPPADLTRLRFWALGLAKSHEECRKIYEGLHTGEQAALRALVHGLAPGRTALVSLEQKGLTHLEPGENPTVFSPLFTAFLKTQTDAHPIGLFVDEQTGMIVVDGKIIPALTGLLHVLFDYLYQRAGEVCTRDEIAFELYPERNGDVADNNIDAAVGRLRKEIEPNPSVQRYLKTVRGRGFRLVLEPEFDDE